MNPILSDIDRSSEIEIQEIRSHFPILSRKIRGQELVYLDNGASNQKPQQVIDAIKNYYEQIHSNVHRGAHFLSQEATEAYENARERVQLFINAGSADEIIFTRGTTESINLVAYSWGLDYLIPGDEILISTMEHHSNIVPWQLIAEKTGASIKVIPINNKGELDMDSFYSMLTDRVKLVGIVHVSNALGTVNPIKEIIEAAHKNGSLVMVDGAQAVAHGKIDVQNLDADFYAFSAHKMYGPTGIGVLYGKREILESISPFQGGGEMIKSVSFEKTEYGDLPHKFEAGTPNMAGAVGLHAAINYMESLGLDRINALESELLEYAHLKLNAIEGLTIYGTAAHKAGVISFLLDGIHPYDTGTLLDQMGIAVRTGHHCTEPLMNWFGIPGTVRASFAIYNTKDEIDKLAEGIIKAKKMLS